MRRPQLILLLALLAIGCMPLRPADSPRLPVDYRQPLDQVVVYSDFPLPAGHRLFDELNAQRQLISRTLQLPLTAEPIHVYLFESERRYRTFMKQHYPGLPDRRAFFVETDTRLAVYAHWSDRVAEDLRHEVAHGYLHAAVPNLPLWLDEGLAEYFEVARGRGGLNEPHVVQLRAALADRWRPDPRRLAVLDTMDQMEQLDYAESWAWVHWLLETTPERRGRLVAYLAELRQRGQAPPLTQSFGPAVIGGLLERHVRGL